MIILLSFKPPPIGGITIWTEKFHNQLTNKNIKHKLIDISLRKKAYLPFYMLLITYKLIKIIIINKPTLAHLNTSLSRYGSIRDLYILNLLNLFDLEAIVHFHCNIEDQVELNNNKSRVLKIIKKADLNIVLNKVSFNFISNKGSHVQILPNFVDMQKEKKHLNSSVKSILFVGHLVVSKGVYTTIEVAKLNPNIKFYLVGRNIDFKNYSFPKNIIIVGEILNEELKKFYLSTDIFFSPSLSEGLSLALLEAMSFGCPIITTSTGDNKWVVGESGGVILPVNSSPMDFSLAIKKMGDSNIRKKMSFNNKSRIKNNFNTEIILEKWLDVYKYIGVGKDVL